MVRMGAVGHIRAVGADDAVVEAAVDFLQELVGHAIDDIFLRLRELPLRGFGNQRIALARLRIECHQVLLQQRHVVG